MNAHHQPLLWTLAGGLLLASCGGDQQATATTATVKVEVLAATPGTVGDELRYAATIEAGNTVQLAFGVPGTVSDVRVQEGDRVAQGQQLASLDAREYANALAIADAGLEQAQDMFNRLDGLHKKGCLPEKDHIEMRTKLAQAQANRNISAKRVEDSRLVAPITGVITARTIEQGAMAAPGQPAFTIVRTDRMDARLTVPESEVGRIRSGMEVKVHVPTLDTILNGTVALVNPKADDLSRTFVVKVKLDNADGALLPGMLAEAVVATGKGRAVLSIPAKVVVRDADGITYAFVDGGNGQAVRRRISTGAMHGDNLVEVTDGLKANDRVIVAGQTRLKDGSAIIF
ncbi:MAG TPA: efflux RND transporter periplasmic adaptor subunit [Flavobacteriales bacterium]|nr:efflux RND transporter periplasmic adaptor subunit [Flavobacteriales bacterium]